MTADQPYSAFEAIKPHFNVLENVGYIKIVTRPVTLFRRRIHNCYRILIGIIVFVYNLQHIIRVVEMRHSIDQVVNTLFILLTTLNTLGKQMAFNLRTGRIDNIINFIKGPIFTPSKPYHVEKAKANALEMHRLLKIYLVGVSVCGTMWAIFPLVNRALGEEVHFTGYIPFDTTKSPVFEICVVFMNIFITLQGYGNATMDCTIVAFYVQVMVQYQILRYNLERLIPSNGTDQKKDRYIDDDLKVRQELHIKFIRFIKEIESIFAEAMTFQFVVTAWVVCMTVYKIVGLSLLSAELFSMGMYLCCMLAQFFIYCYYGTQLKSESEFVNDSIYRSQWLSVSPRFRRLLLIMMENCKQPVIPRTAYIIPISLESYIAVLRASYTLFTFLDRK